MIASSPAITVGRRRPNADLVGWTWQSFRPPTSAASDSSSVGVFWGEASAVRNASGVGVSSMTIGGRPASRSIGWFATQTKTGTGSISATGRVSAAAAGALNSLGFETRSGRSLASIVAGNMVMVVLGGARVSSAALNTAGAISAKLLSWPFCNTTRSDGDSVACQTARQCTQRTARPSTPIEEFWTS